jgi:hypothetical protein
MRAARGESGAGGVADRRICDRDTILWQKAEGAGVFLCALLLYFTGPQPLPMVTLLPLFLAPDLSFFAYLAGPRIGAFGYNCVHNYGLGALLLALGNWFQTDLMASLGLLWLAHVGFDRMLGYGLKETRGFGFTHLGRIGKARPVQNSDN